MVEGFQKAQVQFKDVEPVIGQISPYFDISNNCNKMH